MGKTHEALERADKEYRGRLQGPSLDSKNASAVKGLEQFPKQSPLNRYREVKTKLIAHFPEGSIKTILIASASHRSGSSTIAVGFATALASDFRSKVLLIDANLRSPRLHEFFNIKYHHGLSNLLTGEEEGISLLKKVGKENLYVIPCGENYSGTLALFESARFDKMLKVMREKFDYVIIDAPPVNGYAESKVMGKKADGVILVVESGKTRRQVASRAKQELEEAGAKVLGIILNRRKHYIPEWIYKRL